MSLKFLRQTFKPWKFTAQPWKIILIWQFKSRRQINYDPIKRRLTFRSLTRYPDPRFWRVRTRQFGPRTCESRLCQMRDEITFSELLMWLISKSKVRWEILKNSFQVWRPTDDRRWSCCFVCQATASSAASFVCYCFFERCQNWDFSAVAKRRGKFVLFKKLFHFLLLSKLEPLNDW